jgi:hypothetical protein
MLPLGQRRPIHCAIGRAAPWSGHRTPHARGAPPRMRAASRAVVLRASERGGAGSGATGCGRRRLGAQVRRPRTPAAARGRARQRRCSTPHLARRGGAARGGAGHLARALLLLARREHAPRCTTRGSGRQHAPRSPGEAGRSGSDGGRGRRGLTTAYNADNGPRQGVTIPRQPDRAALRAGPPTASRRHRVGPWTSRWPSRRWGLRLPSGPRSVPRSRRRAGAPSGSPGHGGNRGRLL